MPLCEHCKLRNAVIKRWGKLDCCHVACNAKREAARLVWDVQRQLYRPSVQQRAPHKEAVNPDGALDIEGIPGVIQRPKCGQVRIFRMALCFRCAERE